MTSFGNALNVVGVPLYLQQVVKTMYSTIYAKIRINKDTHGEVMSDIGVNKDAPFFSHNV